MRKSEISFLTACAKKDVKSGMVFGLWAFLKEKDEHLLAMSDWMEKKQTVTEGQLIAKMTQITTDFPVPQSWTD